MLEVTRPAAARQRALWAVLVVALAPACSCDEPLDPDMTGGGTASPGGTVTGTVTPFQGATSWRGAARVDGALRRAVQTIAQKEPSPQLSAVRQLLRLPTPLALSASGRLLGVHEPERFVPGELIVRFREKLGPKEALGLLQLEGIIVSHGGFGSEFLHLIRVRHGDTGKRLAVAELRELMPRLERRPGVVFVELNGIRHPLAVPNDNLYPSMWHLAPINMPAAWDVEKGTGNAVTVAVVDTGVFQHPDLAPRLLPGADLISDPDMALDGDGRDSDPTDTGRDLPNGQSSWHGTHCAGTIGAATDNGQGIAGINWNARIVPVRVLGRGGGTDLDIAAGMAWAAGLTVPGMPANQNPAQVVSMSLGGQGQPQNSYQDVINQAAARNVIFVVAAGNDNVDASGFTPCNQTGVLCIGATRFSGRRASYSNFGRRIDLMAPGGEVSEDANGDGLPDGVLSTLRDDATGMPKYEFEQGTSMATPHIAGVVSLMRARNPTLTFPQVRQILVETANRASQCDEGCGAGLVNVHAAVLRAGNSTVSGPARLSLSATDLFFTSTTTRQTISVSNTGGQPLTVTLTPGGAQGGRLQLEGGGRRTVAPGETATVNVSADLQGLMTGKVEAATIAVASNGGSANVGVKLRAGSVGGRPVVVFLAYQAGADWKVGGFAEALPANSFAFSIAAPAGRYYLLGFQDTNGNGQVEDNEPIGIWPNSDSPRELTLSDGQRLTANNFVVAPETNLTGNESRLIGTPCEDASVCGQDGICGTGFPQGYCTRDCSTAACPAGSKCLSGASLSLCLDTCSGPRAGRSTCRADYVCEDDGTGQGVCIPSCGTIQDFCDAPQRCNTTTGYCE